MCVCVYEVDGETDRPVDTDTDKKAETRVLPQALALAVREPAASRCLIN